MRPKRQVIAVLLGLAVAMFVAHARAQKEDPSADYPKRVITIIVPVGAGGLVDIFTRIVAQNLQTRLGQSVVVDNRSGAGGTLGARAVLTSGADGYTLLAASSGAIPSALMRKPPPFTADDFVPVALIVDGGAIVAVRKSLPVKSFSELIAYAKAHPEGLNYGSTGTGGPMHLAFLLLADLTGVKLTHIPFRGSAPATTALLQGDIDLTIVDPVGFADQIKSGDIRPIAYTSRIKAAAFPDIPTLPDLVAGFDAPFWIGLLAPKGTPRSVIAKLNREMNTVIESGALAERAQQTGMRTRPETPEEFARFLDDDTARWEKVIRGNNLQMD